MSTRRGTRKRPPVLEEANTVLTDLHLPGYSNNAFPIPYKSLTMSCLPIPSDEFRLVETALWGRKSR